MSDPAISKDPSSARIILHHPAVEGLRALAILSVVMAHINMPGFSGGFVGVDIFFVISGFLITRLLCDEALRTGGINLFEFWARRVRRLLPHATVVLIATLVISALVVPAFMRDSVSRDIAMAASCLSA